MKKLLITGKNSYIGTSLENWLMREPDNYKVDTLDMKDGSWKKKLFSKYNVVIHVVGIAHIKETKKNRELYYKVNRDLAYQTALKAREDGVTQFILLSTMSVYGIDNGTITKETIPNPKTHYGKSKLQAEEMISKLGNQFFKVTIIRPPMVYGRDCKGNFQTLLSIVRKLSFFPGFINQRSMIYINTLSNFIKLLIDRELEGLFFPQNKEFACTSNIVRIIANSTNKKINMVSIFNPLISLVIKYIKPVKKAFGNLVYVNMEEFDWIYDIYKFDETVRNSSVKEKT